MSDFNKFMLELEQRTKNYEDEKNSINTLSFFIDLKS